MTKNKDSGAGLLPIDPEIVKLAKQLAEEAERDLEKYWKYLDQLGQRIPRRPTPAQEMPKECLHAFREFVNGIDAEWCMECGAFKRAGEKWMFPLGTHFGSVKDKKGHS